MGRDTGDSRCIGVGLDELPDDLFAQTCASDSVSAIYRTKDVTLRQARRKHPRINGHLYPGRHRRGADPTMLADQINDAPAAIALLQVRESERGHLRAPQATAEKNGEDSSVAQSS